MKDLTTPEKLQIVAESYKMLTPNQSRLRKHALSELRDKFGVGKASIKRYQTAVKKSMSEGNIFPDFRRKRKRKCGRTTLLTDEIRQIITTLVQEYANCHVLLTIRLLREELAMKGITKSVSTIHDYLKKMNSKTKKLHVKPLLTPEHKKNRLKFVTDLANRHFGRNYNRFKQQWNTVHIDESWFYIQTVDVKVRYLPDTIIPESPTTRHKAHIQKVMFLVAMARPQKRPDGSWFDGKIGMWPCIKREPAKRNSRFRAKGTLVTYPRSMDSNYYLELMRGDGINQGIIDAIKEKFSFKNEKAITIQHDGAKPHNGKGNETKINDLGSSDGWKIRIKTQPAQSPDLNIMDLGLFNSLKKRAQKVKRKVKNIDQLIENVRECYNNYDRETLDKIWGLQYAVYNEILKCKGDNQYKLPHTGVNRRARLNDTSVEVKFNIDIFNDAVEFIR